ncbi:RpnC/YadD family protein [Blautia argi]|uniref:Transposase (putative) YhgA-like domain-containing protein n=1 Tax=Blautia argi TaxID=1912897 RepID=A0A2Z4U7P9_9FIRM|nr:hypothetical protein [Blautia argi]AWY97018.1 hypothetical protein DQQ01_01365 [Blautia argi]
MSEGIVYQNKDIEFKLMSETYKEKSFEAYGLNLPKIKEVLPTNLPAVSANEMRIDNLFLLEDDTLAIVDYESEDKVSNRVKYINYIGRIMQRYDSQKKKIPKLRMIVIYTGDVENAKDTWEMPCLTLKMEQVVELAKQIENENIQAFVITGILVSSDKFIDRAYAKTVRRYLSMTKVFQILEEEKQEAINLARQNEKIAIAENLMKDGLDTILIMRTTGLTREQIEKIRENMLAAR